MAGQYICAASEYCGKKETCYHAKPHTWNDMKGCCNGVKCPQLDEEKKANPEIKAVCGNIDPECVIIKED